MFSGSAFRFPSMPGMMSGSSPSSSNQLANYVPVGANTNLPSTTFTQEAYESVRNAKANNSIVLQVLGDDVPIRVLPLPPSSASAAGCDANMGGAAAPTVYVSTLLQQTGVMGQLGKCQAALYRPAPNSLDGIRMDVLFSPHDSEQVRPESDYALRPGDRLVIGKDTRAGLDNLLDMLLHR